MSHTQQTEKYVVTPEEIARRIAEYRLGWEYRSPAIMLFYPPHQECPWPACGFRISGIRFNLDSMVDQSRREGSWLRSGRDQGSWAAALNAAGLCCSGTR